MCPFVEHAFDDLVRTSNPKIDGDIRMRSHEPAEGAARQPIDVTLAGDQFDMAGFHFADAVELRQQALLLAVLAPDVASQQMAGVGGDNAASASLEKLRAAFRFEQTHRPADG